VVIKAKSIKVFFLWAVCLNLPSTINVCLGHQIEGTALHASPHLFFTYLLIHCRALPTRAQETAQGHHHQLRVIGDILRYLSTFLLHCFMCSSSSCAGDTKPTTSTAPLHIMASHHLFIEVQPSTTAHQWQHIGISKCLFLSCAFSLTHSGTWTVGACTLLTDLLVKKKLLSPHLLAPSLFLSPWW
jgi:hypothetical protein